jgi:hypothetical protein
MNPDLLADGRPAGETLLSKEKFVTIRNGRVK